MPAGLKTATKFFVSFNINTALEGAANCNNNTQKQLN